jgi:ABC-2 type transport system permease protein
MKTIYRIAKLELSTLFYSPIAWLVLIVFTFQSGLGFTDKLKIYAGSQELGGKLNFITSTIFSGPFGFFAEIQRNVYLYIPLLTMGLMSREISSGSIKLLLSSPVKTRHIILGKYLAMMAYCFLLVSILALFAVAGMISIASFDYQFVLSGLTGIYLLICAYSAIGLFMSSLTSYQVVAAISTLVVLAALNYVGLLWQDIDFIRDITYFLSLAGRADEFRDGLVVSKDVFYFGLVICLFLGLSIMVLQSGRESLSKWMKAARYALFTMAVLLLGYVTSRPRLAFYVDMTATQTRTLTPVSQEVIRSMKQPLKVTTYVNLLDDFWYQGVPSARNRDIAFWSPFQRFMPGMQLNYVYYYDTSKAEWLYKSNKGVGVKELARRMAKARELDIDMFMPPAAIKKIIDLQPEENRFVRVLEYGGKRSFLREYAGEMNPNPGEAEITAAIKRLVVTPPKVAFLTGENERSIDKAGDKDYQVTTTELTFRRSLVNQGFDVVRLSLESNEVPADIAVLVIADPRKPLAKEKMERIQHYINRGGNILVAGEPGRQSLLNPLLAPLGVQLMDGMLMQESKDFEPDLVTGYFSPEAAGYGKGYKALWNDSALVSVPGSVGLQYTNNGVYKAIPILVTDKTKSWNKTGQLNQDTGDVHFDATAGDVKQSLPVALALTRQAHGKEQRIMVLGDADFMSIKELQRGNIRVANFAFMVELFKWFSYNEYPIDVSRPKAPDNKMVIGKKGVFVWKIIFLGVIPVLLLMGGTTLLIVRKRK